MSLQKGHWLNQSTTKSILLIFDPVSRKSRCVTCSCFEWDQIKQRVTIANSSTETTVFLKCYVNGSTQHIFALLLLISSFHYFQSNMWSKLAVISHYTLYFIEYKAWKTPVYDIWPNETWLFIYGKSINKQIKKQTWITSMLCQFSSSVTYFLLQLSQG